MDMLYVFLCVYAVIFVCGSEYDEETVSRVDPEHYSLAKDRRFLLYDVNPGEGFNLRRDVHMRATNLVRQLREKGENFVLVLPPFYKNYHWQSADDQTKIPWKLWFDLPSLNRLIPVVEFEDYLEEVGDRGIDILYYLQRYVEGWKDGKWEEKWNYRPCVDRRDETYYQFHKSENKWHGWFWAYANDVFARRFECISVQGHTNTLLEFLLEKNNTARSIMIDRMETVMHDHFGDIHYWNVKALARKSMRYSKELREIADQFRETELQSNDNDDHTILHEDWTQMKRVFLFPVTPGQAKGGPYLSVHWRRKDFVRSHADHIPSIDGTAEQIKTLLGKLNLNTVFVCTDGKDWEVDKLRSKLPEGVALKRFVPSKEILHKYKDGGVSIVDQWIAAHARYSAAKTSAKGYFIGSHVSTFSFRIQDDREILGFDPNTSFNRLCPDDDSDCEQPAHWTLVQ